MNKSSLKIFAIETRKELMEKMRTRLEILGITKNGIEKAKVIGKEVEVKGTLYPKESYDSLIRKYKQVGYEELIEESAYIWFNRLTALAFMEANGYIEEKMIFNNGVKNEPAIIDNYYEFEFFKNLDNDLQKELHNLRDENTPNSIEKLYSILMEEKCEDLSNIMPFMFKKKGTYSDILFPTGLLMENSLLIRLREEIGAEAPIELIGWLYQYYNSEKREVVYNGSMKKSKINKEYIAPATQLFTPDWIVKYMVENSLGKLALESTGINENLKDNWKYYIDSEKEENSEKIKIEDIKILDPAMGSGHILVYAFDLLFEMYENLGWSTKESVLSILKNNLYGLEIDERAGQLASFALMMKAREKFSRLFSVLKREEDFKLNTLIIEESNSLSERVKNKSQQNISISKEEWDSRETSWDFEKLSLIDGKDLKTAYENYCNHWRDNFVQLHKNEEELNRLFIEIYDLQDEMDEKVSFDDITILKKEAKIIQIDNSISKNFSSESEKYLYDRGVSLEFNKDELVKQFLSYAVGCIMGRYSINKSGLIIANSDDILELLENKFIVKGTGGEIRQEIESKFLPDEFGIIPITDEKDFSNDIVEKIKEFIKFVYGEENLKDNLNFIAEALGNKDNNFAEEIIRTYFIKDFYSDHLQRYQKRPIYWLMNSGKKNAFSCLFYMHRYEPLTVARVRTDYLIPYQEMLENKRKFIERQLSDDNISAKEKKNIEKQLKELDTLLKELREYANEVKHIAEQKIPLDLDDGVNVNYEKLGGILKKR